MTNECFLVNLYFVLEDKIYFFKLNTPKNIFDFHFTQSNPIIIKIKNIEFVTTLQYTLKH